MTIRPKRKAQILRIEPIQHGQFYDLARRHGRWPYQCEIITPTGPITVTYAISARPSMRENLAYEEACNYADQVKRHGWPKNNKYTATLLFQ